MTNKELIKILQSTNINYCSDPFAKNYISWNILDKELENSLIWISSANTSNNDCTMMEYPTDENYWSIDYPISLEYYPYNYCDIYKNIFHNTFYFIYTEWGGHSPEKRCRLIQEKLIVA